MSYRDHYLGIALLSLTDTDWSGTELLPAMSHASVPWCAQTRCGDMQANKWRPDLHYAPSHKYPCGYKNFLMSHYKFINIVVGNSASMFTTSHTFSELVTLTTLGAGAGVWSIVAGAECGHESWVMAWYTALCHYHYTSVYPDPPILSLCRAHDNWNEWIWCKKYLFM